jgi:hypothetical protein
MGNIDYLCESGARELARILMAVWRKAGHYNVLAEPVRFERRDKNKPALWAVRTNLVNGLPPPDDFTSWVLENDRPDAVERAHDRGHAGTGRTIPAAGGRSQLPPAA